MLNLFLVSGLPNQHFSKENYIGIETKTEIKREQTLDKTHPNTFIFFLYTHVNVNVNNVINYLKANSAVSDQLTITLNVQGHTERHISVYAADSGMGSSYLNTSLVCRSMFSRLFLLKKNHMSFSVIH